MKRKTSFSSSVKTKCNPDSTGHIEEDSSDDQSSKEVVENSLDEQPNPNKVAGKQTICSQTPLEQFISAVNELGSDKKLLDTETWRLNDCTRSNESVWGRLISNLKLNQTEKIRHSLSDFW